MDAGSLGGGGSEESGDGRRGAAGGLSPDTCTRPSIVIGFEFGSIRHRQG